jgi:metal-dependent amidase/aminoacylase/carboxypeptidase family protein
VSDAVVEAMRRSLDGLMRQFGRPGIEGLPAYELAVDPSYPVLVNHPGFSARVASVLRSLGHDVDDGMALNLGAEDFACYLQRVPGVFIFLGSASPAKGITAMNHSDRFDIDEGVLLDGVKVLLALVGDFQENPDRYSGR